MERPKPNLGKIALRAPLLALSLTLLSGCEIDPKHFTSTPTATAASQDKSPTTPKTDMALVNISNDEGVILEQARRNNQGVIFYKLDKYNPDINVLVRMQKLQIDRGNVTILESKQEVITAKDAPGPGEPIRKRFITSSCDGLYRLSISTDRGRTYYHINLEDNATSNIFSLRPSTCAELISVPNPAIIEGFTPKTP